MESNHKSKGLRPGEPIDYETRDQVVYARYRNEPWRSQGEWIVGGPLDKISKLIKKETQE